MGNNELQEYYVAYFDVLGYKKYFENNQNDITLLNNIRDLLYKCTSYKSLTRIIAKADMGVKAFSDNFLLCLKVNEEKDVSLLGLLITLLNEIQFSALAKYGLLLRGGLTKGLLYLDNNLVYGKALIDAVSLEEKAIYPRIIINVDSFNKEWDKMFFMPIVEDEDGFYYTNLFNQLYNDLKSNQCKENILKKIKEDCYYRINETTKEQVKVRASIITKILWLVTKYNEICYKEDQIKFVTRINPKLLKMELALEEQERTTNEK